MSKATLTVDEINEMLTEIAKDPESGADKFRALKMLASSQSATIALPEPLDGKEVTERLTRMIQCAGPSISQVAFRRAFPTKKKTIHDTPQIYADDLPKHLVDRVESITSLKVFYRTFPEAKRHGMPKGYPAGRGMVAQREWLKRAAVKLLLDREEATMLGPEQAKGIDDGLRQDSAKNALGPDAPAGHSAGEPDQVAGT